jgi:hypothetical protein
MSTAPVLPLKNNLASRAEDNHVNAEHEAPLPKRIPFPARDWGLTGKLFSETIVKERGPY